MEYTTKKYELTNETVKRFERTLHRIRALRNFRYANKGDLGGLVESEANLAHEGDCWVEKDACIFYAARVSDNALVRGSALVFDNAKVFGNADVRGNAIVNSDTLVYGNAIINDNAIVYGRAEVYGNAEVKGDARVFGRAEVFGNAEIFGYAKVSGNAEVFGNAKVFGRAMVFCDAEVSGNAEVFGEADIFGDAEVHSIDGYVVFKNWWSSGRYFTWTRSNNMWKVGCFYGTGEELIAKAYRDSEKSGREYERVVRCMESILADEQKNEQQ